ncbi:uncharacterized protein LOC119985072 [Tripterygium wilfordii]|nr:uncharacterized protein LOC119985072 [Tripterygium wilfordii]
MASKKKKEAEGIALLSMYNDEEEDEEMEAFEEQEQQSGYEEKSAVEEASRNDDSMLTGDATPPVPHQNSNSTSEDDSFGRLSPQQAQAPSPQQRVVPTVRNGRGRLTIVDYAHDEVAMSPEHEEMEIQSSDESKFGAKIQTANGDVEGKNSPGTAVLSTPGIHTSSLSSENLEQSESDMIADAIVEAEAVEGMGVEMFPVEAVDLLDKFLPPPPKAKCPEELQRRIDKFLALKKIGKSFNAEVRNRKDYRNPDFLLHAVRFQEIDQIGSCLCNDVFDPHGYDKSDYYDEIESDMNRDRERKEQERKKSPKVEFVSGGTQPGTVIGAPKFNLAIPGVPAVVSSGLPSVPTAVGSVVRDGRQNKKSKWDKVDVDQANSSTKGTQDLSTAGTHTAILNAGAGYTAFAQQRRREAEERKSSERKFGRRT